MVIVKYIPYFIAGVCVILLAASLCFIIYLSYFIFTKHKHKWHVRGRSRWQNPTYRVCLTCGASEKWEGGLRGGFIPCERIKWLDNTFDENNNLIIDE